MYKFATTLVIGLLVTGCSAETTSPSSEAQAAPLSETGSPIALAGDFRFGGEVEAIGRLTVDVIDTRMSDSATRLEALRAQGATCRLAASNTYRCTKMNRAPAVPASSLEAIATKNRELFASFGEVTSSPSLVTDAESLTEWKISQRGATPLGAFEDYRYLDLQGDLVKIILPGQSESLELIVKGADRLAKWDRKVVNEGRWRWHEDMALVILTK